MRCRAAPNGSSLFCQEAPPLAEDFRVFEKIRMEAGAGVEDLDADEPVVFPVEDDEGLDAFGRGGGDTGAAAGKPFAGEVDVGGVGGRVVGDPHSSIVPCASWTS